MSEGTTIETADGARDEDVSNVVAASVRSVKMGLAMATATIGASTRSDPSWPTAKTPRRTAITTY